MRAELASSKVKQKELSPMAAVAKHASEAAAFLKAVANDQRLMVLCCLLDGPLSVRGINDRVPLSQSALSQHLGVLREAGLVTTSRQSQTIFYTLVNGPAFQIMEVLYAAFCAPNNSKKRAKHSRGRRSKRI